MSVPTVRWSWSAGPWKAGTSVKTNLGGPLRSLDSATGRSLSVRLKEPSTARIAVNGLGADADVLEELITDLWVYRDGVALFRGRLAGDEETGDDIDEAGHATSVGFVDYRGVLARRIRWNSRQWIGVSQETIVWDAITDMQAEPGGSYGLAQAGDWPVTGVSRPDVLLDAGVYVGEFIDTLSAFDNGFDWDIDENLNVHLYYPQRGQDIDTGAILDYGNVVAKASRRYSSNRYANAGRQTGAEGVSVYFLTINDLGGDIANASEGRWETSWADTALTTADMVANTAKANLLAASTVLPVYTLTLAPGMWGGPSHVWVGDYVQVVIKSGRLNEQVWARVHQIDITLDASNHETVTISAGSARITPQSVLRGIMKRINKLAIR